MSCENTASMSVSSTEKCYAYVAETSDLVLSDELMCSNSMFNMLNRFTDGSFLFLFKKLVFLFLPLLNLGAQIKCPQNQYTILKSATDQPLAA